MSSAAPSADRKQLWKILREKSVYKMTNCLYDFLSCIIFRHLNENIEAIPSGISSSAKKNNSEEHPNRMEVSDKTTGRQLQRILHYSVTPSRPLVGFRQRECAIHDVDCDEVYPGIFIGDAAAAKNKVFLRMMGITHVLNTAEGSRYGQVDTGHSYYRDMPTVRYMGFPMMDQPTTDISRYFYIASKFIENAVNSGGKILVHCLVGMSRSATCVLAYLMICRKMSAVEAIRTVRLHRDVRPNDGFLQQLADLDNELRREKTLNSSY